MRSHSFDVELNRFTHKFLQLLNRVSSSDATWHIRKVRSEVGTRVLNDERVLSHPNRLPNPAWRTMLARIPLGRSLLGGHYTVTVPDFVSSRN